MDVVEKIVSTVRGWNETKTPEARLVSLQEGKKLVARLGPKEFHWSTD